MAASMQRPELFAMSPQNNERLCIFQSLHARKNERTRLKTRSLGDSPCRPPRSLQLECIKTGSLHFRRLRCIKRGGLHAFFMQTAAFFADALLFPQDSLRRIRSIPYKPLRFLRAKRVSCKPLHLLRSFCKEWGGLYFATPSLALIVQTPPFAAGFSHKTQGSASVGARPASLRANPSICHARPAENAEVCIAQAPPPFPIVQTPLFAAFILRGMGRPVFCNPLL